MTFRTLPDYYSHAYFRSLAGQADGSERAIWAVISVLGRPSGYLDLGCGDGAMVQAIYSIAHGALGMELSEAARDIAAVQSPNARIIVRDLRRLLPPTGSWSLVTCIDVVDWVDGVTPAFWANVAGASAEWLVWTGKAHRSELEWRGLRYCARETERVAAAWRDCLGDRAGLADEVLVFRKEE